MEIALLERVKDIKKGRNLLDKSKLLSIHPHLYDTFHGELALLRKLVFAKRMEKGWTQQELASKAKVDLETITRIESGVKLEKELYDKIICELSLDELEINEWVQIKLKEIPKKNDFI